MKNLIKFFTPVGEQQQEMAKSLLLMIAVITFFIALFPVLTFLNKLL